MAAAFGPYWLNAETFEEATGVWDDSALTTCASEGYYSNGVIQRYLEYDAATGECCLGPALNCPSCIPAPIDCSDSIPEAGSAGGFSMYITEVSFGNSVGVAFAFLNPFGIPDAMAVEYPADSGQFITEGVLDNSGYVANNIGDVVPAVATTGIWDYAIMVGNVSYYNSFFPGEGISSPAAGSHCTNFEAVNTGPSGNWPIPMNQPSIIDVYKLNDAGSAWIIDPVQPDPNPWLTSVNWVGTLGAPSQGMYPTTTTKASFMGMDAGNVFVPNSSSPPAGPTLCDTGTDLFIPIPKNSTAFVNAKVCWFGTDTQTGYDGLVSCPIPPTQFSYESATVISNVDPAWTPACDTAGSGPFDASFWMANPFHAFYNNATTTPATLTVRGFCYTTALPSVTDLRLNEGSGTFTWYRVNMMDQPLGNQAAYTNDGTGDAAAFHNGAALGPQRLSYEGTSVTSVWVQVDTHGLITRIETCEVTN